MSDSDETSPLASPLHPREASRDGLDIEGRALQKSTIYMLALGVCLGAWVVHDFAQGRQVALDYFLIVLIPLCMLFFASNLFYPPKIKVNAGHFNFKIAPGILVETKATNVSGLAIEKKKLRITFSSLEMVEPENMRASFKTTYDKKGAHLVMDSFFTPEQVDEAKKALGLVEPV